MPRRLDLRDRSIELRPVRLAAGLQVIDLGADVRLAGDRQRFVDRLEQTVAFAAHVRDVHAARLRGDLGEFDEFVGLCEHTGDVDERSRQAHGALVHRPAHVAAHPLELLGRGRTIVQADLVGANGRGADERRNVGRNTARLEKIEIAAKRIPGNVERDVALPLHLLALHLVGDRPHRALTEHFERHALPDGALRVPVGNQRGLGVAQHVDEAGSNRQTGRVHFFASALAPEIANGRDAIALNRHIGGPAVGAGAVVDGAVPDHDVVLRRLHSGAAGDHRNDSDK